MVFGEGHGGSWEKEVSLTEASTIFRWEGFYHSKRNKSRMIDAGKRGLSWLRIVLLRLVDSMSDSNDSV
jgi:hypothetical protein